LRTGGDRGDEFLRAEAGSGKGHGAEPCGKSTAGLKEVRGGLDVGAEGEARRERKRERRGR